MKFSFFKIFINVFYVLKGKYDGNRVVIYMNSLWYLKNKVY